MTVYLGDGGRAERRRVDGVTNGDVPVGAHDCQQQRARELIHRRRRHVNLFGDTMEIIQVNHFLCEYLGPADDYSARLGCNAVLL